MADARRVGGPDPAPRLVGDDPADRARLQHVAVEQALLAAIVRGSRDAIFTKRPDGTITSWNLAAERLYGWPADEILGRRVGVLVTADRADEPRLLIERVLAGEPVDNVETRRLRKDGTVVDVALTISPVHDDAGAVVELSVIGHDISERRRAEAVRTEHLRLVEGMDRLNQAIHGSSDVDQVLGDVLDATVELLGCDRAVLLHPCDPEVPEYTPVLERTRSPEIPVLADGHPIPRSESTARLFRLTLDDERPIAFGVGSEEPLPDDVVERIGIRSMLAMALRPRRGPAWLLGVHQCDHARVWRPAERELLREIGRRLTDSLSTMLDARELERSEAMYRRLVDTATEGIWAADADGITTFANDRMCRMLGRPVDEIVGRPVASFLFDEDLADHARLLGDHRSHVASAAYERRFRRADGTELWAHLSAKTLYDDSGAFAGVFGMVSDIGDRRQAEEALRQSEEKFATAFRMSPDLIILTRTTDGVILDVNDSFERMLGYPREAAVGRSTAELGAWADDADRVRFLTELAAHGQVRDHETVLRHRDGRLVIASTSARMLSVNGEPCLLSVVRDVTASRLTQLRLRESEAKYRSLLENLPDPIVRVDADLRRSYVNHAWELATGIAADDAIGTSLHEGAAPWFAQRAAEVLATGLPADAEFDATAPDGRTLHLQYSLVPELDAEGAVTSVLAVGRDLTERRRAEELRIATQTAERASQAKSAFIATMSHEIRTPMNAILGFAQLLRDDPTLDARQRGQIEVVHTSGEHLLALVNDVLELSRIEAGRSVAVVAPCDLHALLAEVGSMFAPRAQAKGLTLRVHRPAHVPHHVVTDEGKLRQILINVIGNAVKFTSTGHVTVLTDHREPTDPEPAGGEAGARGRLVIDVVDTGRGITAEDQTRLFGYFEQAGLPEEGETGSGLGLAISRGFARLLGGDLTVRSTLGHGSRFRCEIDAPRARSAAVRPVHERQVVGLAEGERPRRILVADDSAPNRELVCELLDQVGFETRGASDGQEAVDLFGSWRPDLVLMDMRMPTVDGREATRRIRELDTGARVVAVTADIALSRPDVARAAGVDRVLTKPFRAATLIDVVGDVLGVGYRYDDEAGHRTPVTAALDPAQLGGARVRTAAIDGERRSRLLRAAEELDFEEVAAIAAELDEPLTSWLRARAEQFDAESILTSLLDPAAEVPDGPPR